MIDHECIVGFILESIFLTLKQITLSSLTMSKKQSIQFFQFRWLIPLVIFDILYFLFVQLLILPLEDRKFSNIYIQWEAITFMVFAGIVSLYTVLLARKFLQKYSVGILSKYLMILGLSLVFFIAIVSIVMFTTEYLLGMQRDINYVIGNAVIFIFHHFIISNTFIAYLYLKESGELKNELLLSEKSKADLKLKVLQHQMSPHFLFNNLNTLVSLIKPNEKESLAFTKSLSSIYRYFSTNMKEDVVSLSDELEFIDHYFELMRHRFGTAYHLNVQDNDVATRPLLCVPMCLQLAIENVIKHNSGDRNKPLNIDISISEDEIKVENAIRPKPSTTSKEERGEGLNNLNERCQLIMDKSVRYHQRSNRFTIIIPLIKQIVNESTDH